MRTLILLFTGCIIFTRTVAQEYRSLHFSAITSNESLPSDECNLVFQDSDDFLWFGTNEGLYRYDGYEVRDFDKLVGTSFRNAKFFDAGENSRGQVWFATSIGAVIYNKIRGEVRVIKPMDLLPSKPGYNTVICVAIDKKDNAWLGMNGGVLSYNVEHNSHHFYSIKGNDGRAITVRDIVVSQQGHTWIATWGAGLYRVNEADSSLVQFDFFNYSSDILKHNVLNTLHESSENLLWVGSWGDGLYALDISDPHQPSVIEWFSRPGHAGTSILGDIIFNMATDRYGSLWIGSPYGLSIVQNPLSEDALFHNYVYEKESNSLTNNAVQSIVIDRTGVAWLGTVGGGVNKTTVQEKLFRPYFISEVDEQKKSQTVCSFSVDPQGRLLVGIKSLGFGVYDKKRSLFTHFSRIPRYAPLAKLDLNTVKSFTWDKDSNLWMGTRYLGMIKFNVKTGEWIRLMTKKGKKRLHGREVLSVKEDEKGNLWVVTDQGLAKITMLDQKRLDNYKVDSYTDRIKSKFSKDGEMISDVDFDQQGNAYISTFEGSLIRSKAPLYRKAGPLEFISLTRPGDKSLTYINCLFFDKKDQLWVGSLGQGLKKWNDYKKTYDHPLTLDKIEGRVIYAITGDQYNNLWATSNEGLLHLTFHGEGYQVATYTVANGLQGNVFVRGAILHDENGTLYIGGHNGFNYFDALPVIKEEISPKVAFTSLKIGGTKSSLASFNEDNPFVIPYNNNLFSVSFSALDMRTPTSTRYAYQLEGLEHDWQIVSSHSRTATYVNLDPGRYTFKVRATNAIGQWNSEIAMLPIIVEIAPYLTWWAYGIYSIIVVGVFLVVFLLYRYQMKAKQELKLEHIERTKSEKLNQFKLQFFTNLSHELLTPLSVLLVLSGKLAKYQMPEHQGLPRMFKRNVDRLNEQIKQMLQFRKAETGSLKLEPGRYDLDKIIREIYENHQVIAVEKNIFFQLKTREIGKGFIDREKVEVCINNLVSNAFKYTKRGGAILLEAERYVREERDWIMIRVKDSGRGIPKEQLRHIFNRFYRASYNRDTADGIGIGLALVKSMVQLHGGTIKVKSEPGKGSAFTVRLPVSLSALEKEKDTDATPIFTSKILDEQDIYKLPAVKGQPATGNGQKKTVLLVEDNEDLLSLIAMHLEKYYHVISASDGREGIHLADNHNPDLIISDLMMPAMDGYEFCKAIKTNVNTSHIPFVIITANTHDESRAASYEVGADSYLAKPVDMQVLVLRAAALLRKRSCVNAEFSRGISLEPQRIATNTIDEEILSKAKALVEDNMSDANFSVKALCRELGMSNSMLYRKIKGILDINPNEFIRNIRLRKAAQLLEDGNIHISEVAYQVGFNDLSYFGVCFKKQYGMTPSTFQEKQKHGEMKMI